MMLLAILFGTGLLYYTLSPLGEASPTSAAETGAARDDEARLESALVEILDLESDYETGKIAEGDYRAARAGAERRAAKAIGGKS